jgi:transposase-like protein
MMGRSRGMNHPSSKPRIINAAQRGLVVQRVIVDGWTVAAAAAAANLPEHLIATWVADFRRHGMASLHRHPRKTVAAANLRRRLLRPAWLALWAVTKGVWWLLALERRTPPSPRRQSRDDRRGGS